MSPYDDLYLKQAVIFKLDSDLVRAIAEVESGHNPWVTRFEPQYRYFFALDNLADQLGISRLTLENQQGTSWGVLQVMAGVAYERGFRGYPPELSQPEVGIHWGCAHLAWLRNNRTITCEEDLISSYNQGSPIKTPGGLYRNQKTYVDKVALVLRRLRGINKDLGPLPQSADAPGN